MRSVIVQRLTEATVLASSAGFLGWYVWVKLAACPSIF